MRKINFKKLILEKILLLEAATKLDWSAKQLFEETAGKPTPSIPTGYLPHEFKSVYSTTFGIWPDATQMEQMTNILDMTVTSRGGAGPYKAWANYFPLLDLMFVVLQSNALGAGDFKKTNTLLEDQFKAGTLYSKWIDQLKTTLLDSNPLDWIPKSALGTEVGRQLNKDQLAAYAAQLTLDTCKTKSILQTVTFLLEVRKEARWSLVSKVRTTFGKQREQSMPKEILDVFSNPQNYAGGVKAFPASIKNKYDNTGGLELQIFQLALACDNFYKTEKQKYTPGLGPMEGTKLIELLENKIEAGSTDSFFHFIKPDNTTVAANQIGTNGYTIGNLKEYAQKGNEKAATALWEKLKNFADYTKTDTWSWKDIIGGAKRISGAIGGMAGSFGK